MGKLKGMSTPAPTVCQEPPFNEKLRLFPIRSLTCTEIAQKKKPNKEVNFCGSQLVDDDGNFLGKAKFVCVVSCGLCIPPPSSIPSEEPTVVPPPTVCEDLVDSPGQTLQFKNQKLTCKEIAKPDKNKKTRCGSKI